MTSTRRTTPLEVWTGTFGDAYTQRNAVDDIKIRQRIHMWRRILQPLSSGLPENCLEVGAGVGINLRALRALHTIDIYALEPNANARSILVRDEVVPDARVINGSAECISLADASVDLVFTSGVLVLVEPTRLEAACREMHRVSRKYILTIEYFANEPEEKTYRGETGLLFKRDFGVFWLDLFPTLSVIDYGFFWKPITGLDNLTWWLFAKS